VTKRTTTSELLAELAADREYVRIPQEWPWLDRYAESVVCMVYAWRPGLRKST
jgi:hypothetical protein